MSFFARQSHRFPSIECPWPFRTCVCKELRAQFRPRNGNPNEVAIRISHHDVMVAPWSLTRFFNDLIATDFHPVEKVVETVFDPELRLHRRGKAVRCFVTSEEMDRYSNGGRAWRTQGLRRLVGLRPSARIQTFGDTQQNCPSLHSLPKQLAKAPIPELFAFCELKHISLPTTGIARDAGHFQSQTQAVLGTVWQPGFRGTFASLVHPRQ